MKVIALCLGGSVHVEQDGSHVRLGVTSPLAAQTSPAVLTRDEAETVHDALGKALARLRVHDAKPEGAEESEALAPRKKRA